MTAESPVCINWLEVGALGLHHAPEALYSEGLTDVPWKEPASNRLYDDAPSKGATKKTPMNHVKYLRAGPAEMPFQTWYTTNTNHFCLTDFCQNEIKSTTGLSNKPSTA